MERAPGGDRHSDDELASALEEEVARITSAIPIITGAFALRREPRHAAARPEAVGEAEPVEVDAAARPEPVDVAAEPESVALPEPVADAPAEDVPVEDAQDADDDGESWVGPPTVAISFEDLPVRRERTGPQPTFSPWVAGVTGVIPVVPPAPEPEPAVEPEAVVEPEPEPEPPAEVEPPHVPSLSIATTASAEPPAAPAPTPAPTPESVEPVPLPTATATSTASGPITTHTLGPATAPGDHIDRDVADDADDVAQAEHAPLASRRLLDDEAVLSGVEPTPPPLFVPETTDLEASPLDRRVGRASRLFWLWFAATSSLISVGVGATLFTLGLSLRQLLVATLVGVALSFLPLGLGTLAGKWSGQPTMVVSRATFGMLGNIVPTVLALLVKLFWGAVLLWLAGTAAGSLAVAQGWASGPVVWTSVALVLAIAVAGVIAWFGYALVARVQLVLTIASAVLIVIVIAATWPQVDVGSALAFPDALWTHVITGAVIVFSYLGLAWAMSSAEVARYQRPTSSGATGMLWATFGAAVPPLVLVSYGGLLAASSPELAVGLARDPVGALARLGLPWWFAVALLLSVVLSLISALVLTCYSAGFTLDALGVRLGRRWSTLVTAGAIALAGAGLALTVTDLAGLIRGIPTALSVPIAAWSGIFAGEMMLRMRRFHQPSLLERGGVYPDWRWVNLGMLVVASVVGFGLVSSDVPWLAWEGYLFRLAGVDTTAGLGATDIGVPAALALGLLTPMVAGIPAVRRQERVLG